MIADNIKYLRKEVKRLSQKDFAELLGVTRGMIDTYERRVAKPDTDFCNRLANLFGISVNDLLNTSLNANTKIILNGENSPAGTATKDDIIAAKNEQIELLKQQIEFLKDLIKQGQLK